MSRWHDRRRRDIEKAAAGRGQEQLYIGDVVGEARKLPAELRQALPLAGREQRQEGLTEHTPLFTDAA
jgi:hypothetical protein